MPYSAPCSPPAPNSLHARRSRSAGTYFSDESGRGTFTSLGPPPRLTIPNGPTQTKRTSIFHFKEDTEDGSNSFSDADCHSDDHGTNSKPPSKLQNHQQSVNTRDLSPSHKLSCAAIPFPSTSPPSSSPLLSAVSRRGTKPLLPAATTSPTRHSNPKPLKSSLKCSSFSSSILRSRQSRTKQSRSHSAPPMHPKNVHFAEKDLETITIFSKHARPASLRRPEGDDTESEIDSDCRPSIRAGPYLTFPHSRPPAPHSLPVLPAQLLELDYTTPGATSTIPSISPNPHSNVFLESLVLSSERATSTLTGTVVVRNLAYEKQVAVRFTVDEWQTTSEVSAHHLVSLMALPHILRPNSPSSPDGKDSTAPLWDRFSFAIPLDDAHNLHERVLWFAVRFSISTGSGREWWDNNSGKNYRVGFRVKSDPTPAGSAPTKPMSQRQMLTPSPETSSPPSTFSCLPLIERRNGISTATTNRLRKFSMANYVAPTPASKNMNSWLQDPPSPPAQQQKTRDLGILTPPHSSDESNETTPLQMPELGNGPPPPATRTQLIAGHPATMSPPRHGNEFDVPVNWRDRGHPRGNADSTYTAFLAKYCFCREPASGVKGGLDMALEHRLTLAG